MESFNVVHVAKLLQVSYWTARAWIKQGRIKGFKIGPHWVVTEESLNEFLARCRKANDFRVAGIGDQEGERLHDR